MRINVNYDINEDLFLGWTVVLSDTVRNGNMNRLDVMIYPLDVKPTARQMRKFKSDFRKETRQVVSQLKDEAEWEDCIIDRLGWDIK